MPNIAKKAALALCITLAASVASAASPYIDLAKEALDGQVRITPAETLNTGKAPYVFQTSYQSSDWSGKLHKRMLVNNADNAFKLGANPSWEASELLTQAHNPRTIATYNSVTNKTVLFNLTTLSHKDQIALSSRAGGSFDTQLGEERVRYLSGERELEQNASTITNTTFRKRSNLLGDIVHSIPVLVSNARNANTDKKAQRFVVNQSSRPDVVYVGANDGMLHAFHAESGSELFAYIPSPLIAKLSTLTSIDYQHDAYMDGNIGIGEVQIDSVWKTILSAGMGAGAKGVFALDISTPNDFMNGLGALFEFTEQDDADIGYITCAPSIIKLTTNRGREAYFVAVPSGYNSSNRNGDAFLFLLSLDKKPSEPWMLNRNYFKIKAANSNPDNANALAAPAFVLSAQGTATLTYAGDLQGNLWRFDLQKDLDKPNVASIIFTAKDHQGNSQPISAQPLITNAPQGGYLVLFGTGKYVEAADKDPQGFKTNSFYAVRDSTKGNAAIAGRDELTQRKLTRTTKGSKTGYTVTGGAFNYGENFSDKKGWYIDFANSTKSGERSIESATAEHGHVFFNTHTPGTNIQAPKNNTYVLNVLTGFSASQDSITGYSTTNVVLTRPIVVLDSEITSKEPSGRTTVKTNYSVIMIEPNSHGNSVEIIESGSFSASPAGRLSWREIQNWRELNSIQNSK